MGQRYLETINRTSKRVSVNRYLYSGHGLYDRGRNREEADAEEKAVIFMWKYEYRWCAKKPFIFT